MNGHRWHSLCNALLMCVAVLLTATNRLVFQPTSPQWAEDRQEPAKAAAAVSGDTDRRPLQGDREGDRLPCSAAVRCYIGNSSASPATPHFHRWETFFGEPWTSRQMFFELRGVERETPLLPPASTWIDWPVTYDSPDFRVVLHVETRSGQPCGGVVAVMRKRAQPQMCSDGQCIRDDVIRTFVRKQLQLGDDDFRVRVVGPEIVSALLLSSSSSSLSQRRTDTGNSDEDGKWYTMPFTVATPGTYHIEAEQMYEGFRAFDEASRETIPMVRKPLLPVVESRGNRGQLEAAQHHSPFLNLYVMNHPELGKGARKSKFRSSKHFIWDQFSMRSNVSFVCQGSTRSRSPTKRSAGEHNHLRSGNHSAGCFSLDSNANFASLQRIGDRQVGQWVLSHYNKSFPRYVSPVSAAELPGHHVHFERTDPQAVFRYHLLESSCESNHAATLQGFTPSSWYDAMQRRRQLSRTGEPRTVTLVFIGDSHMRVTYTHARNFFVSSTDCSLEDHTVKSMSNKGCVIGVGHSLHQSNETNVHVMFSHDVLLRLFVDHRQERLFDAADVVVLGMGSWAIGGQGSDPNQIARAPPDFGRWPLRKYRDVMVAVAEQVVAILGRNARLIVVWVTVPAYPPNTRRFAKLKGEHRTNARIFAMNRIAQEVLSTKIPVEFRGRVRVVDAFDVTYPVMHLSLDHNHFTTYPQDAILHLLLNAML